MLHRRVAEEAPNVTIDPLTTAGLVTREVHTGTRDGTPTRVVVARRTYATDQADLWRCLTDPQRLPRWFLPVSGELEVGGRYRLEGNASGTIERCDAPEHLAVTWEFGDQVSWLRLTLHPAADGTTLELQHEAPVDPAFWAEYGPGAGGVGWDLALMGLGLHLDTAQAVDPAAAQAWATSTSGVAFVRAAARGWADAGVADGDDPVAAHEAAERTVTFYTVPPEPAPAEA
jgi:uncharacterized protein YndB with AHSA1/START domain